jgi:hypothetical protein
MEKHCTLNAVTQEFNAGDPRLKKSNRVHGRRVAVSLGVARDVSFRCPQSVSSRKYN